MHLSLAIKERLIHSLVALLRAEAKSAAKGDIQAARLELEQVIGSTVSRAASARLLGVSQTALDRWVRSGDIPVVMTPAGRFEVPLRVLVDLMQAVDERRRIGDDHRPLASVLHKWKAEALPLDKNMVFRDAEGFGGDDGDDLLGHRGAELRSLFYHRAVAQKLDDRIIRDAQERLQRWKAQDLIDPRYAEQWEDVLSRSPDRIAQVIEADTQQARDLRQNSPFAGALSERERLQILSATVPHGSDET